MDRAAELEMLDKCEERILELKKKLNVLGDNTHEMLRTLYAPQFPEAVIWRAPRRSASLLPALCE